MRYGDPEKILIREQDKTIGICVMNEREREERNRLIDVLFDQVEKLNGEDRKKADIAIWEWQNAKTASFFGLGSMTAQRGYKAAYKTLKELGLEVGGMLEPCKRAER